MGLETRYQMVEKVGAGSFATVFRARDTELGREVAIKQIHQQYLDDPAQLERYWQEAQLLASLSHPNIVPIYDIRREKGWLILELMQASVAERMAGRQMDLKSLRSTLAHALRALRYLHERGIIHGDIKPGNLMIDSRRRIKIGDFGLARRASNEEGSLLKGTTKYMAPETVSDEFGEVRPASDLYSLGFSAYELMCGPNFESLFPGLSAFGRNKQMAWMMWHAAADRRLPDIHRVLEGVPDDLAHVIQKLCEKDQSRRYSSADQALEDLDLDTKAGARGDAGGGEETAPDEEPADGDRKKQRLLVIGAFAISLLLSVAMLLLPSGTAPHTSSGGHTFAIVRDILPDDGRMVIEDIETGVPEEIQLSRRPRIFLENTQQNVLLRELQPGDRVEFQREAEEGAAVEELTAARPITSAGRVDEIDLETARLVSTVDEGEYRGSLSLRVPERAEVLINGARAEVFDLQVGDRIVASHFPETRSEPGRIVHRLEATRLIEAAGFVTQIDPQQRRVQVNFGLEPGSRSTTLPVADEVRISRLAEDGEPLDFSDLKQNDRIRFQYDTAIRGVMVSPAALRATGRVREVRASARQLLVRASTSENLTFTIPSSGEVMLGFELVELDDLREDDRVDITYDESGGTLEAATVDATRNVLKDRWAVVIGTSNYNDKAIAPLRSARSDARLMHSTLLKRYAFSDDRLFLLEDATRAEMEDRLKDVLSNARGTTQVLVFLFAHAFEADGSVYVAGRDFQLQNSAETGLPLSWLAQQLEASAAGTKLLFLDGCHYEAGRQSRRQPASSVMLQQQSQEWETTAAIAACADGQQGGDVSDGPVGIFAEALADGFGGQADRDRDVRLTADEIFSYLELEMPKRAASNGTRQTPVLFGLRE